MLKLKLLKRVTAVLAPCAVVALGLAWATLSGATMPTVRAATAAPPTLFVWPISGTVVPALPYSSAYGPRLRAGCNLCYDYHQGVDIPTAVNTTLLAVTTGTVRIAGSHPSYSDGVVQLDHGGGLYSNYLHINASLVVTDQVVGMGQPVALSGVGDSGFPHLHFEIRHGSVFREDAINPLRYLPYPNTISHTIVITEITPLHTMGVQTTFPGYELDLGRVTITVRDLATNQLLDSRVLDYEARNKQYGGSPTLLDNPLLDDMLLQPAVFASGSPLYVMVIQFRHLNGVGDIVVEACAIDVHDNSVCTTQVGSFGPQIYLPFIKSSG